MYIHFIFHRVSHNRDGRAESGSRAEPDLNLVARRLGRAAECLTFLYRAESFVQRLDKNVKKKIFQLINFTLFDTKNLNLS